MTTDVVALVRDAPSGDAILRAIAAAEPGLRVGTLPHGAVLQLFDENRLLVASVETPRCIRVAGEAERLLDVDDAPEPPYWWVELRCPIVRPGVVDRALAVAAALTAELGGVVWRSADPD